jgi:excisionase family DNA binding protein
MDKLLLDIPDAASVLSISRSALYELLAEGSIKSVKTGKRRLVVASSLHDWIASLPTTGLTRKDVQS